MPNPGEIVPEFRPFAGIRYDCEVLGVDLSVLCAPPYDVIDEDHRAALEAAHPANAVNLILPRDGSHGDRYTRAAETFRAWRERGFLATDSEPRFYAYRMDFRGPRGEPRHTLGVVGALALPEGDDRAVLPHERTLPEAKSDRLGLIRAIRANLDPIWGLSLTAGLSGLLGGSTPLARCTDEDGVAHTLGAIDVPDRIDAVAAAVGRTPLVLADGHHRFETALTYRRALSDAGGDPRGAGAIMALVVELAEDEVCIQPIHRLLTLPARADIRSRLGEAFTVRDAGPNTPEGVESLETLMAAEGGLGLVDGLGLALLLPRPNAVPAAGAVAPVPATDAALVEEAVVPRLPGATTAFRHDGAAVAALVDKGLASAALLLRPVSVEQTRAAALAGLRMPQKTTFFYPKPRTGMVFRSLDD